MKLLLFAFLVSSAAAAEFGGRRPALRALREDEQLLDVQQDIEFSMSMASAGSAMEVMEVEVKSAKSAKLFKSSKTSGDEEICVPPSSTDPFVDVYPDAEQQQMLLHQATDGKVSISYLSEGAYNVTYGDNEMENKTLTTAGRVLEKDPSNLAWISKDALLDVISPELLAFTSKFTTEFIPSRIDGINSALDAKSLCATICEELSSCVGFEFVEFGFKIYNCAFVKEGIAIISDYPARQLSRTAELQSSLLLKDPNQFISSSEANFCDVPQGAEALREALECFGIFSYHLAVNTPTSSFPYVIGDRCIQVGAAASYLLGEDDESLKVSADCFKIGFMAAECLPLLEKDFVKHLIPSLGCLSEWADGNTAAVVACQECVFENYAETCANICDEEDDGSAAFLKKCDCDGDEQCECKCKSCGDVCPETKCTAKIQSAVLCSVGTGAYDKFTGCINSNIEDTEGNLIEILKNDFECAFKNDDI